VLDFNGDGKLGTVGKGAVLAPGAAGAGGAGGSPATPLVFDWDGSGYLKQTGWLADGSAVDSNGQAYATAATGDAFLALDRNGSGLIDNGKELFSNSAVADNAKGLRSLAFADANADGLINSADPVFNQLRVWQDLNHDGNTLTEQLVNVTQQSQDLNELKTLAEVGITQIDYRNNSFTRNGQSYYIGSPNLAADEQGSRTLVVQHGIVVADSAGSQTFVVKRVNPRAAVQAALV
jgi:hypothetical protein